MAGVKHIERAVVLSLPERLDRRAAFARRAARANLPFEVQMFDALNGRLLKRPASWTATAGAYGCYLSHLAILDQAIADDVQTLAVFEDDVVFCDDFTPHMNDLLARAPWWDALMLGGEHHFEPDPIAPGIVQCRMTIRTHAYVVARHVMEPLRAAIKGTTTHFDFALARFLGSRRAYAPDPFLCWQDGSESDCRFDRWPAVALRPHPRL